MNLDMLYDLCDDEHQLLAFLQENKLLVNETKCIKCKKKCHIFKKQNRFVFRCPKCYKYYSTAPDGYFFHKSHIKYDIVLKMLLLFLSDFKVCQVATFLNVGEKTVIDWFNFFREICANEVLNSKEKLGGTGKKVEVDELVFESRKRNKGQVNSQWAIGGIERESGKCFLVPVGNRDSNSLKSILEEYIEPGTTVITDDWHGCKNLKESDLDHLTINHNLNFVDKTTGAHMDNIESEWGKIKAKIPRSGRYRNHFRSYLCTYVWMKENKKMRFENFITTIAKQQNQYEKGKEKGIKRKRSNGSGSLKLQESESWQERDSLQTPEDKKGIDNDNEGTTPNSSQFHGISSENILSRTDKDPSRPMSDDELMRSRDCGSEFSIFGESVSKRLNSMPRNGALRLRLKIEELVTNFRQQMSSITPNKNSFEEPSLCDKNFVDIKMEIKEEPFE